VVGGCWHGLLAIDSGLSQDFTLANEFDRENGFIIGNHLPLQQ